jgi:hypothetical protein
MRRSRMRWTTSRKYPPLGSSFPVRGSTSLVEISRFFASVEMTRRKSGRAYPVSSLLEVFAGVRERTDLSDQPVLVLAPSRHY